MAPAAHTYAAPVLQDCLTRSVEHFNVVYDTRCGVSHFLSDFHWAVLSVTPSSWEQRADLSALQARLEAEHDCSEIDDLPSNILEAVEQLTEKNLIDRRTFSSL